MTRVMSPVTVRIRVPRTRGLWDRARVRRKNPDFMKTILKRFCAIILPGTGQYADLSCNIAEAIL